MVGGFAKLAADIVLRNDSDTVSHPQGTTYHGTITLQQFNDSLAPIKAKYPAGSLISSNSTNGITANCCSESPLR